MTRGESRVAFGLNICVFIPDFWHHEAMLHHECVTDGCHHSKNLLAGRVPPHQVEQSVGLVLRVKLVDTLLRDQLDGDPAVVLRRKKVTGFEEIKNNTRNMLS